MTSKPATVGEVRAGDWNLHLSCGVCEDYAVVPVDALAAYADEAPLAQCPALDCPNCGNQDTALVLIRSEALVR